ncbi:hypothetical protein [Clostridium sp. E02]|uniref:hypothetical protein n=1 Tax=Clostridium sp. E02 TaxID=2487134 RepID=UPI000F53C7BC|nr:hypothetical protein [Clostridium sp. E02]
MENETTKYKLPKPGEEDFYDINQFNKAMDLVDGALSDLDEKKLDQNGDASNAVTEFKQEILRENLESGEKIAKTHGKIKKWFSEMKEVAFSGRASDIEQDGVNRFVTDLEKKSWNTKVSASGGDISETKIESLDGTDTTFPVPVKGETSKVFFGKVKKFIEDFNDFKSGIITVGKLVNHGKTTDEGYALDARFGKTLFDLYGKLDSDLQKQSLHSNVTYYVATTGSDTTGNGSELNPFRTIQHAIDVLPKDLGGYDANITVFNGTYDEDVVINGYCNGYISLKSTKINEISSVCSVSSFLIVYCSSLVVINGFDITTITRHGIEAKISKFVIIYFCRCVGSNNKLMGMYFDQTRFEVKGNLVANKNAALNAHGSDGQSMFWDNKSINNYIGLYIEYGSIIKKIGTQPIGELNEMQSYGGLFIHQNGTQISDLISSGLTCTWAKLQGGYIRHGNMTGTAMVTVQITIVTKTSLTTGESYSIKGFPLQGIEIMPIAVSCHYPSLIDYCQIYNGELVLKPRIPIGSGTILCLNCTYLTT